MKIGRPVTIAVLARNYGPATDMTNHDIAWTASWLEKCLIVQKATFQQPVKATPMVLTGKFNPDYLSTVPGYTGISRHWFKTLRDYQRAVHRAWEFFVPIERKAEIWDVKDTDPQPLFWNIYTGVTYSDDDYKKIISEEFSTGFVAYVGLLHKTRDREAFMDRVKKKEKIFTSYKEVSHDQIVTYETAAELDKEPGGPEEFFVSERIVFPVCSPFDYMTRRDAAFLKHPPMTSTYARQIFTATRCLLWSKYQDFTQARYQVKLCPKQCRVLRPIFPPKNWRSAPTYY